MKHYTGSSLRYPGYTFFEILVVIALIMLVAVISSPRLGRGIQDRTEIKSAAMRLTEDLRYLRQLALASGSPTALVIPSDNLTKSHCQGYIMKKGLAGNEIIRIVDFQKIFKKGSLFVGYWNLDTAKLHNPALTASGAPIQRYANSSGFNVGNWGNGSRDYIFLFTPQGAVLTNDNMPHFDNAYHIVVGECFTYSSSSLLPGSASTEPGSLSTHYMLSSVWSSIYTVTITPAGEIACNDGLDGALSSVHSASTPQNPGVGASLYGATASLYAPIITDISLFPANLNLPPGFHATVNAKKYLKIVVIATDVDRSQLYLKPQVTVAPDMAKPGTFSAPGYIPMEYDPLTDKYMGVIEWCPPESAADEEEYDIQLTVSDVSQAVSDTKRIKIINKDQICFYSNRDGNFEVYAMYIDGSLPANLTRNPADDRYASWSSQGGLVAFTSNRLYGNDDIILMNCDGTDPANLTTSAANNKDATWSPDGARIAFASSASGNYDICKMYADGSFRTNLTGCWGAASHDINPSWSPDTTEIAFASEFYGNFDIFVVDNKAEDDPFALTDDPEDDQEPSWSPDGSKLVFSTDRDGNFEIYVMNSDGTGPQNLSANSGDDREPCFSPDGSKIVFSSNRDGNWEIYVMNQDGSDPKNISNNPATDRMPQFGK